MTEKIKLFELANRKIENQQEFMAFYLRKYLEIERISEKKLCSELNCSIEAYYKLALCKAPDFNALNFITRLKNISKYTGIEVWGLSRIIKRVNTIHAFSETDATAYLMAARDMNKQNKDNNKNEN